jgi:hypothetical protein
VFGLAPFEPCIRLWTKLADLGPTKEKFGKQGKS